MFCTGVHLGTSRQIFLASQVMDVIVTGVLISAGALLAFMLGVSEYLLVYHTSSLTLSISGVVKVIKHYSVGGRRLIILSDYVF